MGRNHETTRHHAGARCRIAQAVRNRPRHPVVLHVLACLALAASPGLAAADSVGPQYGIALPSASGQPSPGKESIAEPMKGENKGGVPRATGTSPEVVTEPPVEPDAAAPSGEESRASPGGSPLKNRNTASTSAAKKRDNVASERTGSLPLDEDGSEFPWLPLMLGGLAVAAIASLLHLLVRRRRDGNRPAPGRAR